MKAITICQPYAQLIVGGAGVTTYTLKRVENRQRYCGYCGPLAIHAGLSKDWLPTWHGPMPEGMVFGAIVGVTDLSVCLSIDAVVSGGLPESLQWVKTHLHTIGPYCWILNDTRRLLDPIPMRGRQGLFNVADKLLHGQVVVPAKNGCQPACRKCGCTGDHACPGGCHWVEPDLCSACAEQR